MSLHNQYYHNEETFVLVPGEVKKWFFNIFQQAVLQLTHNLPYFVKKVFTKIHGTAITLHLVMEQNEIGVDFAPVFSFESKDLMDFPTIIFDNCTG